MSLSESPFTNRLNTNYVPSDSEILEIRSLLVGPKEEIARIDARIEELESTLAQLREQRALLQSPIDAHSALISPVRLIPQDVLLEIFFSCLPSEHNALIDPTKAPLLLGRICRHWRSVAYSVPMLWIIASRHRTFFLELERIVEAWLERSAPCPLSVSLYDFTNRAGDSNPNLGKPFLEKHPLVPQLLAVSRRLRCLALDGDAKLLHPLLKLGEQDVPLLKRIRMNAPWDQLPSTNIFEIPTIEELTLMITVPDDPLSLPLRWSQLTNLRLECECDDPTEGLDFDGALDLLRKCPNLEQCEIRVTKYSDDSGLTRNSSPIILLRLHTLAFTGYIFHLHKWVLDLVAPNLRSMKVGDVRLDGDDSARSIPGYLSAHLEPNRFTSASLLEFLQSLPKISHLRLSSYIHPPPPVLDDAFVALFSPPHNLCPTLIDINFSVNSAGFTDAAALNFIKGRMAMPTPLQRFRAEFKRPMELDIMPELQSFISDGLQVAIKYPPQQWVFRAQEGLDDL
ncbi:hypothetical protein MSAN_01652300 [Mycena sanguinolenta]|uniref:F-box domain-containing protein n=1 Tax=Mycena sanguinolenta TaxID=230812 RepID=A0A8H6Y322_9AGAR|nr:hypothetical protein MSAN_01652300 [Mycena sanguinolenta]